ncbi:murein transglycosylase A [Verticiella sediminum]
MRARLRGWRVPATLLAAAILVSACTANREKEDTQARAILEQGQAGTAVGDTGAEAARAAPALPPGLPPAAALRAGQALPHFTAANWSSLPASDALELSAYWDAMLRNCQAVLQRGMRPAGSTSPVVAARAWRDVCVAAFDPANGVDPSRSATVQAFLQKWLQPWAVTANGRPATNTVTGYYEPLVRGARQRSGPYQWPLYAVPDDMLIVDLGSAYPELAGKRVRGRLVEGRRVVPYDTRADIARSENPPKVLVWVDDPVDAFFLQVQGSGRVELQDGLGRTKTVRMAYADQNGHTYASIGRWLVDQGELTLAQASMQNIREWARRNPGRVQEMLNANPSVIFFKEEPVSRAGEGPRGAFGVPLTAQHSIAVDPQFVPLGAPVFLSTTYPGSDRQLNRLVFAQDTGSAIKGAARADFFWGFGDEAGDIAGRMKQPGRMWVLWPKGAGAPAADR